MPENNPKIIFEDNTKLNFNFYTWKFENLKFFLQIYEFVNTVNFGKMTLLIRKCLQHVTSDDKCATKQPIEVQFLNVSKTCISRKSHTLADEENARKVFLKLGIFLRLFSLYTAL